MYARMRVQGLKAGQTSLSESDSRLLTPSCDRVGSSEESQYFPPFLLCKVMLHRSHVKYRAYSF